MPDELCSTSSLTSKEKKEKTHHFASLLFRCKGNNPKNGNIPDYIVLSLRGKILDDMIENSRKKLFKNECE